ncbi:hypothetical protein FH972_009355 [Carpinus fangiana]|uniref:Uncharacterized protein n=1 Tax=Carpinus fangiana TaxID=176857 RepID=A0A5N6R1L8_9ROSI|nr:hypothetical protein FH972_009355 [Carpinus fangiana]
MVVDGDAYGLLLPPPPPGRGKLVLSELPKMYWKNSANCYDVSDYFISLRSGQNTRHRRRLFLSMPSEHGIPARHHWKTAVSTNSNDPQNFLVIFFN